MIFYFIRTNFAIKNFYEYKLIMQGIDNIG